MSHQDHKLSRRQFLGYTGASAFAALTGLTGLGASPRQAEPFTTRVHLHAFDPALGTVDDAVRAAFLAADDLKWLRAGDSVFVKVAANSNLAPPSVTSPAVLAGVINLLYEAGAGEVIAGDMSGALFVRHLPDETIGSTRENMRQSGLLDAAEAAGATVHCFEEVPYAEAYVGGIPPGEHHWGADLQVAEVLDRVDHVINLPRLGKHVLAGASLGLKNAIGWVSDHSRMVLHRDADTFHEKIAEVNAIPQLAGKMRLTLTLVDKALTTYGPDEGYALPLDQPLIIAAPDVVSHDQVALLALLWARGRTPAGWLNSDPYPAESNGLNWWFVRVTWGQDAANAYRDLPAFNDLASSQTQTHINLAFDLLHGGRPEAIEVIPGGDAPLDALLLEALAADPALNLRVVTG